MVLLLSGPACLLVVRMLSVWSLIITASVWPHFPLHSSSPECISHFRPSEHLDSFSLTTPWYPKTDLSPFYTERGHSSYSRKQLLTWFNWRSPLDFISDCEPRLYSVLSIISFRSNMWISGWLILSCMPPQPFSLLCLFFLHLAIEGVEENRETGRGKRKQEKRRKSLLLGSSILYLIPPPPHTSRIK